MLLTEQYVLCRWCCKVALAQPRRCEAWGASVDTRPSFHLRMQHSPDAVVDDPRLLWHEGRFGPKAAAARHQAQLAQQRRQEAAGTATICTGDHHQRARWNVQREVSQHRRACCKADRLLLQALHNRQSDGSGHLVQADINARGPLCKGYSAPGVVSLCQLKVAFCSKTAGGSLSACRKPWHQSW